MGYSIRITDNTLGIAFDAKRENMAGKKEFADPIGYSPEGKTVARKQLDMNTGAPIQYVFKYIDEDGKTYEKNELTWKIDEKAVKPIEMTTVFNVKTYRPLSEYNDRFIVERYYELAPSTGASAKGKKKVSDKDRDATRISNMVGMRKLWDKLIGEQVVAGGAFNASTGSFKPGMAWIRAIKVNGTKWGLELGVFKEEKIFSHLQEGVPQVTEEDENALEANLL